MERMEPAAETPREVGAEERRLICPWCDSDEVEKVSEYGPHLMVYSYICRRCNSPFEVIKR
jgi:transposase-like protein